MQLLQAHNNVTPHNLQPVLNTHYRSISRRDTRQTRTLNKRISEKLAVFHAIVFVIHGKRAYAHLQPFRIERRTLII